MTLRSYEYLAAVGRYRHFGKAALACNISQSALSSQIKKIESQLGVSIFERTTKHVSITEAGSQILEQTLVMLRMAKKIDDTAASFRCPAATPICVGMEPALAPHLFGPFYEAASKIEPETRLICRERPATDLIQEMDRRIVDFSVVVEPEKPIDYQFTPVLQEQVLLGVSKTHRLALRNRLDPDDIPLEELIAVGDVNFMPDHDARPEFRMPTSNGHRIENVLTALHLIKPEAGCVLIPELSRHHVNVVRPDLRLIAINGGHFSRKIGIVSRRGGPHTRWLNSLCEQIKKQPHLSLASQTH